MRARRPEPRPLREVAYTFEMSARPSADLAEQRTLAIARAEAQLRRSQFDRLCPWRVEINHGVPSLITVYALARVAPGPAERRYVLEEAQAR